MSDSLPGPGLTGLERALSRLAPAPTALARDRVMFEAGRAAGRRGRLWPASAAFSSAAAVVFGLLLLNRPGPVVVERTVVVRPDPQPAPPRGAPAPAAPTEFTALPGAADAPPPGADYLRRRQEVLRWGVEALPEAPPQVPAEEPLTAGDLREYVPPPPGKPKLY